MLVHKQLQLHEWRKIQKACDAVNAESSAKRKRKRSPCHALGGIGEELVHKPVDLMLTDIGKQFEHEATDPNTIVILTGDFNIDSKDKGSHADALALTVAKLGLTELHVGGSSGRLFVINPTTR